MIISSSGSKSLSSNHFAAASVSKTADTTPYSAPVRTSSRLVRAPSTAPSESTMIDLPAPVSPVRTVNPLPNSISAFSITAIFSICSCVSIGDLFIRTFLLSHGRNPLPLYYPSSPKMRYRRRQAFRQEFQYASNRESSTRPMQGREES